MRIARATFLFSIVCLVPVVPVFPADGTVTGFARYPKIIDWQAGGYIQMYEWNLFLSPLGGTSIGQSRRVGAPPGEPARHDGYYGITAPAGLYSLYVNQPLFFARPALVPAVTIAAGTTSTQHVAPAMDFCCNLTDTWALPWDGTWYQTFRARGTSITGVSFRLAGTNANNVEVAVLAVQAGRPPGQWPIVGSARTTGVAGLADNWVKWRSGLIPTTPDGNYAIRLRGVSGGDMKFSPFNRAKGTGSYPHGQAYNASGVAQDYDLNITVFSDSDAFLVTMCKTTSELGELRDGFYGGRWGQTFKAQGSSLAAADVWAAGAESHWDLDFTFTVRENGPQGKLIGPSKTTKAAYQAFGAGLHAVSYCPGEVSLVPGRTYYIEFTNPEGFNPYVLTRSQDAYPDGSAYQDGVNRNVDLSMTILEYLPGGGAIDGDVRSETGGAIPGATLRLAGTGYATSSGADGSFSLTGVRAGTYTLNASANGYASKDIADLAVEEGETLTVQVVLAAKPCAADFQNGGFEDRLVGWTLYGGAKPNTPSGEWFGGITAAEGSRFQGNEVNGSPLAPGGLYQQFCATPGSRYRAEAHSNVYWIGGNPQGAMNRIGLDPTGGISPVAGTVAWSPWHQQPLEATEGWATLRVEAEAAAATMTVFLDFLQVNVAGGEWHINCFDAVAIEDLTPAGPEFRRGDCNGDADFNVADAICILSFLFAQRPTDCRDAIDTQDDGELNIADAIYLLQFLFAHGPLPPAPGTSCGRDPDGDELECGRTEC